MRTVFLALAALFLALAPARAVEKAALVIGNGAYQAISPLANPGNDAADMAAAFGRLGYKVTLVRDGDLTAMTEGLRGFLRDAGHADSAVVYYSGHGIQVNGDNFLLPVSARIRDQLDVDTQALSLSKLNALLDGAAPKVRLIILDSCRDNPLAGAATRSLGAARGLARVDIGGAGTLVAYATKPGSVAADGSGRNSPFTSALLKRLDEPAVDVRRLFALVRQDVVEATSGVQIPLVDDGIVGDFSFGGGATGPVQAALVPDAAAGRERPAEARPSEPRLAVPVEEVAPAAEAPISYRPSFACTGTLTSIERRICGDAELARLDRSVTEAYFQRVRPLAGETRAQFAQLQRDWLVSRDACGDNAACLEASYRMRLGLLQSAAAVDADPPAARPSFDCGGRLKPIERLICASPELAGLDRRVGETYGRLAGSYAGGEREALVREQRQWIGRRNRCGLDAGCLADSYRERLAALLASP